MLLTGRNVSSLCPGAHADTAALPVPLPFARKQERRHIVIIKVLYSEVRLDPIRETYGHGQGSGLSGEAESSVAGFRFAPFAAAN
jgi:hypothetical protein